MKKGRPPKLPAGEVLDDYLRQGLSFTEVGKLYGVSRQAVHQRYHRWRIERARELLNWRKRKGKRGGAG